MNPRSQLSAAAAIGLAALLLVTPGAAVAQPADSTSTPPATTNTANPDPVVEPELLLLPHPVDGPTVEQVAEDVEVAIVGYRHEQDGVVGEVFPNEEFTLAQFEAEFQIEYQTEPQYTGVIFDATREDAAAVESSRLELENATDLPEYASDPVVLDNTFLRNSEGAARLEEGDSFTADRAAAGPYPINAEWAPGPDTEITATQRGNVAQVETWQAWVPFEGHTTDNFPLNFGMEIDVVQYNPDLRGIRPACFPYNIINTRKQFWAGRDDKDHTGIITWSVTTESGGPQPASIDAYFDWLDAVDDCGSQTIGVGIAKPRNVARNIAGIQTLATKVRTYVGEKTSSRFSANYSTVFNDCEFLTNGLPRPIRASPNSSCMNLTPLDWTGPGERLQMIVNRNRGWSLPTCTRTSQDSGWHTEAYVARVDCPEPFNDTSPSMYASEIRWMYDRGITTGYGDGYRPLEPVKRDTMAAFLYRLKRPFYNPPPVSPFFDVPPSNQFYREISWVREAGISTGWADGTYRPLENLNRDALAAYLYRLVGSPPYSPPPTSRFSDVPTSNMYYKEISWLATSGISTGWPDGTFRPLEPVSREAMAAFLFRVDKFL